MASSRRPNPRPPWADPRSPVEHLSAWAQHMPRRPVVPHAKKPPNEFRVQFTTAVLKALGGTAAVDEVYHQYRTRLNRRPKGTYRCTVETPRGTSIELLFCSDSRGTRISLPSEALSSRVRGS